MCMLYVRYHCRPYAYIHSSRVTAYIYYVNAMYKQGNISEQQYMLANGPLLDMTENPAGLALRN